MSVPELAGFFLDLLDDDRVDRPEWASAPIGDLIADRLGDLMYYTDDALHLLLDERATRHRWLAPELRKIYDDVNQLMRRITD